MSERMPSPTTWVRFMAAALRLPDGQMDVPCNGCTACCQTDSVIPVSEFEPAAAFAEDRDGKLALYPVDGHCPMFKDGGCSIYESRPHMCRVYDCRMHVYCGVSPGGPIGDVVRERWAPIQMTMFRSRDDAAMRWHLTTVAQAVYGQTGDVSGACTAAVGTARMAQQDGGALDNPTRIMEYVRIATEAVRRAIGVVP